MPLGGSKFINENNLVLLECRMISLFIQLGNIIGFLMPEKKMEKILNIL